jgi:23S rRNA-/tRNA-specific pseudouridylate synthase
LKKIYLARVLGDFGEEKKTIDKDIICLCKKKGIFKAIENTND